MDKAYSIAWSYSYINVFTLHTECLVSYLFRVSKCNPGATTKQSSIPVQCRYNSQISPKFLQYTSHNWPVNAISGVSFFTIDSNCVRFQSLQCCIQCLVIMDRVITAYDHTPMPRLLRKIYNQTVITKNMYHHNHWFVYSSGTGVDGASGRRWKLVDFLVKHVWFSLLWFKSYSEKIIEISHRPQGGHITAINAFSIAWYCRYRTLKLSVSSNDL